MLGNLEDLLVKCDTEQSREQIGEAIACYYGGAYRSAIVSTYTAVCYDLIEKLKILAQSGDANAQGVVTRMDAIYDSLKREDPNAIKRMLEFERDLIPLFKREFDFFSSNEVVEILRIRDDRNKCAHPSFFAAGVPYRPTAELARTHIVNAVQLVLSQRPRQGKYAIKALVSAISDRYFPDSPNDIQSRLKSTGLDRAREPLVSGLIDELCFALPDKGHVLHVSVAAMRAVEAVVAMYPQVAPLRLKKNIVKLINSGDPGSFECACILTCRNPDVAESLDEGIRSAVRSWVPKQDKMLGAVVARAVKISWLRQIAIKESERVTAEHLSGLLFEIPIEIISVFASRYARSKNWNEANENYQSLIAPHVSRLRQQEIEVICKAAYAGDGDLVGSHGFNELVSRLVRESTLRDVEAIINSCGIAADGKRIALAT